MNVRELLNLMVQKNASDLHLKSGRPPLLRIRGELTGIGDTPLSTSVIRDMIAEITSDADKQRFDKELELDCAYSLADVGRFRINVFLQRQQIGAVIRLIPLEIKSLDQLGFPQILKDIALKQKGLVLVTGPTGSGKSTTLAAIVNHINENRRCHIMTIEDPIEFVFEDKKSVINQRELGSDTKSFSGALKHVLRQDPDVILIGEMRDQETIALALTAAETGHIVLSTLHTTSAAQTIDRIIDTFPPHQQQQVRSQLSTILEAVISQLLLPTADGMGRVAVQEMMVCTPAVRNLIREDKIFQIPQIIQTGAAHGMQSMDAALTSLYKKGKISYQEALAHVQDAELFKRTVSM